MNKEKLIGKIESVNKAKGIDKSVLLRQYIYERLIERISLSEYRDSIVLKGGFYLSSIVGLDSRTTKDIDACLKNKELTEKSVNQMFSEIIKIDLLDGVAFEILKIESIKTLDNYGGYKISIAAQLENIKEKFSVDIATGDIITPSEIKYTYKSILEERNFTVLAYTVETVIAEKLQTILSKNILGSRMKDYYDLYLINKLLICDLDSKIINEAIHKTFANRSSLKLLDDSSEIIKLIKDDKNITSYWEHYCKRNSLIISWEEVILIIEKLLNFQDK